MSKNGVKVFRIKPRRICVDQARLQNTIGKIRSNLKDGFTTAGVSSLPHKRSPNDPVWISHFNAFEKPDLVWTEHETGNSRSFYQPIDSRECALVLSAQMIITEVPVVIHFAVATCVAVTLYDRARQVGAAIHLSVMDSESDCFKGFIALALHKMGALRGCNLFNVEAKILGAQWDKEDRSSQLDWVYRIRSFLADCSLKLLPEEIGKDVDITFDLSDGSVETQQPNYDLD